MKRALDTSLGGVIGSDQEFVAGVAGVAGIADVEKPGLWRTRGCSGFGARLLADFAVGFGFLTGSPL
jgi:hypothetical protein